MNILLVESKRSSWGNNNQPHGLLKIGTYHKERGDTVQYVKGNNRKLSEHFDKIYIASIFSYWENYYIDSIKFYRNAYPSAEVIFGGIYAINAYGRVKKWENKYGITVKPHFPEAVDCIPAVELLPKSDRSMASLLTSRGCDNNCSYCSSSQVYGKGWKPRSIDHVIKEIIAHAKNGVFDFILYDDNFFYKSEIHAIPLLKSIIRLRQNKAYKKVKFAIPSGFQASYMTQEIAYLMWEANFKGTLGTSIESVSSGILKRMGRGADSYKASNLETCIGYMKKAGYKAMSINVFFICGLPFQTIDDMLETAIYIHQIGCLADMQRFAPIPGTVDFKRCGLSMETMDMSLTEGRKFISDQNNFTDVDLKGITSFSRWLNVQTFYAGDVNLLSKHPETLQKGIDKVLKLHDTMKQSGTLRVKTKPMKDEKQLSLFDEEDE